MSLALQNKFEVIEGVLRSR